MSQATTASKLLSSIRAATGLSQAELARRANMTRSVVNAYEHGSRQPSVEAMARIAMAGGYELTLAARRPPVDPVRASRILTQVVDLAALLPYEPSLQLEAAPLPPFESSDRRKR
ncbi:MAG: helix-turn-helix transcriptional regulator [Thermoleophilaceae bacterium]|nr:helix-turn-helix transcriptional regulator [Thermoleophilaceae bacterium]